MRFDKKSRKIRPQKKKKTRPGGVSFWIYLMVGLALLAVFVFFRRKSGKIWTGSVSPRYSIPGITDATPPPVKGSRPSSRNETQHPSPHTLPGSLDILTGSQWTRGEPLTGTKGLITAPR